MNDNPTTNSAPAAELRQPDIKVVEDPSPKADLTPPKPKDRWDKAGVIAQYLSGVVIAAVGAYFTYTINKAQQSSSAANALAQVEVSNRQQTSTYINQIVTQTNPAGRADLISSLDLALRPEEAAPVALRFARPDQNPQVRLQAIGVLKRVANNGKEVLKRIQAAGAMPDSAIAAAILGEKLRVKVRVSQIDDFGFLFLSVGDQKTHQQFGPKFLYGQDSGWLDITDKLVPKIENVLLFRVANGTYGGTTGRLEVSVGTQQYDSRLIDLKICRPNADAFFVIVHLVVYDQIGTDGSIGLAVGEPETYPWPGKQIRH